MNDKKLYFQIEAMFLVYLKYCIIFWQNFGSKPIVENKGASTVEQD